MTRHSRRTLRRQKRAAMPAQIILTSLIDIFTVLLFFLLIHAASVEVLPEPNKLKLPESSVQVKAKKSPVVMVSSEDITLEGKRIAATKEALANGRDDLPALKDALTQLRLATPAPETPADGSKPEPPKVTIMGDKAIPYKLLRKVMVSCSEAGYQAIALAVMRRSEGS
jgi:biopolymer transport protein ExbD